MYTIFSIQEKNLPSKQCIKHAYFLLRNTLSILLDPVHGVCSEIHEK